MTNNYEFRIFRQTQRVHIFGEPQGDGPKISLCGEVKHAVTLPNRSEPLARAKKYAVDNSYTCKGCADVLSKRS